MTTGCKIESIGVKYPDKVVSTSEILEHIHISILPKVEFLTGIRNRRFCSGSEDSLTLALDAVEDCLKHSQYKSDDIEMIIYCSISKYANGLNHCYEPPMSLLVKHKMNNTKALNFDITNACAGMMTGTYVAQNFISNGTVKNALVVSGEYISSISNNAEKNINSFMHPELASLTVGDAGAAVILTQSDQADNEIMIMDMVTLSQYSALCFGNQNSHQPGGKMETDMKKIHEAALENSPVYIEASLKKAGLRMRDIDFIIPHQTAKQSILSGMRSHAKYFGEEPRKVVINLEETGNTASTTHFTTLYKYLNNNEFKEGNRVMLLSYASGLVIGIMIFTVSEIISRYGKHY